MTAPRSSMDRQRRGWRLSLLPLGFACATLAAETIAQPPTGADDAAAETIAQPPTGADDAGESAGAEQEAARDAPDLGLDPAEAALEAAPLGAPNTRLEAMLEADRLVEAQRYEEALPVAERLIELTEQEFGAQSMETAEAYQRAARIQHGAERHDLAEQSYLHALELIRGIDGPFSSLAIGPLIGLGDSYHAAGQYVNAITAYNEARTVNRRVFGLLNEGQVPILDRITQSFEQLDQYAEADAHQLEILNLAERNHPVGSPEHLQAIYRYAGWLRATGRYTEERAEYSRAMRLIRTRYGKDSPHLATPLRETGNSYRVQRLPENQGISALRSALELLEQNGGTGPLSIAETLRDIGDWEIAFSKVEPDLEHYRTAWGLLGEAENGEELRREWFGQLHNVLGEPISHHGLSRDPQARRGYVIVEFDLDRFGRTDDVTVARSDPPGFKDEAVARAVRRWRFRPFIEDGEIVAKSGAALQFSYRYLPEDLPSNEAAP